jgi:hypothetical protein
MARAPRKPAAKAKPKAKAKAKAKATRKPQPPASKLSAKVELGHVIEMLLTAGYSPSFVARTLDVQPADLVGLGVSAEFLTPADAEVRDAVRRLANRVVNEAERILEEGSQQLKMSLVQKLLTPMMKFLTIESPDDLKNLQQEMAAVLREVRDGVDEEDDDDADE